MQNDLNSPLGASPPDARGIDQLIGVHAAPAGARILVFVPAYRCERQIVRVIEQFTPEVMALVACVAIVENRSPDGTLAAARAALARTLPADRYVLLQNRQNNGLGGSHKVAFNLGLDNDFTHLIVLHGDDQGDVADLVPYIRSGDFLQVDCLLGARFMPGSRLQGYSLTRKLLNKVCNLGFSAITRSRVRDLGAGLNMYRLGAFSDRKYLNFMNSLAFNQVLLLHSIATGHRIRFFPLSWRETDQISNLRMRRMAVQLARNVVQFAFARRALFDVPATDAVGCDYDSLRVAGDGAMPKVLARG